MTWLDRLLGRARPYAPLPVPLAGTAAVPVTTGTTPTSPGIVVDGNTIQISGTVDADDVIRRIRAIKRDFARQRFKEAGLVQRQRARAGLVQRDAGGRFVKAARP